MEYYHYKKERSTDTCYNLGEPQKHEKWKKSDTEVIYCMIVFIWNIKNKQIHGERKQLSGYQEMGNDYLMGAGCSGWWKGLETREVMVAQRCECSECHWIIHSRIVNGFVNFTFI